MNLATKYRPKTFDDIKGQSVTIKILRNQIENKDINNMLFSGNSGCGKTTAARAYCNSIDAEVIEIDAASNNGVDNIRNLTDNAYERSLSHKYKIIILDEAQNTTSEQMKMFLTRMGFRSRVVVTGDITQTDLPAGKKSGLAEAVQLLRAIPEIGIVELTGKDIVRHELVQQIVEAYESSKSSDPADGKE